MYDDALNDLAYEDKDVDEDEEKFVITKKMYDGVKE